MIEAAQDLLSSLNTWLVSALFVGVFFQFSATRAYAAFMFYSATYLHELFLKDAVGITYYGSAACFELFIIWVLSGINPPSKMVINLQRISLGFVVVNFAGFGLWFFYCPPFLYNLACTILYILAFTTLILRDKKNVDDNLGGFALAGWLSCFRFSRNSLLQFIQKDKTKT